MYLEEMMNLKIKAFLYFLRYVAFYIQKRRQEMQLNYHKHLKSQNSGSRPPLPGIPLAGGWGGGHGGNRCLVQR